jgi:uncharacterized protein (DUF302 family)
MQQGVAAFASRSVTPSPHEYSCASLHPSAETDLDACSRPAQVGTPRATFPSTMLHTVQSRRTLPEIEQALADSAARHKFGILATHDLRETMRKKGVEFNSDCRIYEVCNPVQAKKVLEANGAVSTALPCRISVYDTPGGGYTLATLRPTELMQMFGSPQLGEVAQEVEAVLKEMMADAAGLTAVT